MTAYHQTTRLLKTFHDASDDASRDIFLSLTLLMLAAHKIREALDNKSPTVGMENFIKISCGVYSPNSISNKFQELSKGVLSLGPKNSSILYDDRMTGLELIQLSLTDKILPQLDVAPHDWELYFPTEMSYSESQNYFANHQFEIMDTLELVKAAYENTCEEIRNTILPNTSYILEDMGIQIK